MRNEPTATELGLHYALAISLLLFGVLLLTGCVTRVTVCTTYDRRLGRERPDVGQYGRDNVGASVCADVERE